MTTSFNDPGQWDVYNQRKKLSLQDPNIFCPDEVWEFNYLMDNIVAAEPHLDPISIMLAIRQGMRETIAPRPRHHFIQRVMSNIREREDQWAKIVAEKKQDIIS